LRLVDGHYKSRAQRKLNPLPSYAAIGRVVIFCSAKSETEAAQWEGFALSWSINVPTDDDVVQKPHNLHSGAITQAFIDVDVPDDHHDGPNFQTQNVLRHALWSLSVDVLHLTVFNASRKDVQWRIRQNFVNGVVDTFYALESILRNMNDENSTLRQYYQEDVMELEAFIIQRTEQSRSADLVNVVRRILQGISKYKVDELLFTVDTHCFINLDAVVGAPNSGPPAFQLHQISLLSGQQPLIPCQTMDSHFVVVEHFQRLDGSKEGSMFVASQDHR